MAGNELEPERRLQPAAATLLRLAAAAFAIVTVVFASGCAAPSTEANGASSHPVANSDGEYVAFASEASNLVPDDHNDSWDVFVKNTRTGEIVRASTDADGREGDADSKSPAISADGRYVAFASEASNLVPGDEASCSDGVSSWNCADIFVKDMKTGEIEMVSTSSDGNQGNWFSETPSISADGRYVAFTSYASNLIPGDGDACDTGNGFRNCADVFVKDRETGLTRRISVTPEGVEGNGDSTEPAISADGSHLAFTSRANSLGVSDGNGVSDVFLANLVTGDITRISRSIEGIEGDGPSSQPAI